MITRPLMMKSVHLTSGGLLASCIELQHNSTDISIRVSTANNFGINLPENRQRNHLFEWEYHIDIQSSQEVRMLPKIADHYDVLLSGGPIPYKKRKKFA